MQPVATHGEALTALQQRLAEAELDYKVSLQHGSRQAFVQALTGMWHDRMLVNKLSKYIGTHQDRIPKSKEDRIGAMFDIFRRTN